VDHAGIRRALHAVEMPGTDPARGAEAGRSADPAGTVPDGRPAHRTRVGATHPRPARRPRGPAFPRRRGPGPAAPGGWPARGRRGTGADPRTHRRRAARTRTDLRKTRRYDEQETAMKSNGQVRDPYRLVVVS